VKPFYKRLALAILLGMAAFFCWKLLTAKEEEDPVAVKKRNSQISAPGIQGGKTGRKKSAISKGEAQVSTNNPPPEPLPDSWYAGKPVITDNVADPQSGMLINADLTRELALTAAEKKAVSGALSGVVKAVNSRSSTVVNDGGPPPKAWVGAGATLFRIAGQDFDPEQQKGILQAALQTSLGAERGETLWKRIALAAENDPILRGFGANPMEITFKAVGSGDIKKAMVYWDYKITNPAGTAIGEGSRSGPGLPMGIKDLVAISEE
jgi:hypothetical protein